MRPAFKRDGLQQGQANGEDEEDHRNGRPVARPEKGEALLHHCVEQDFSRFGGAAFSQHRHCFKNLETPYRRNGNDEYKGGAKHRPSDAAKALPGVISAIHGQGLIKIFWDSRETRHEEDHGKAQILPNPNGD